MNNILIISLEKRINVSNIAVFASSLKKKYVNCFVYLCVSEIDYFLFELKNIQGVFLVELDKIKKIKKSKQVSLGSSINILYENIKPLKEITWEKIINFDTDSFSRYLISYLSHSNSFGPKIENNGFTTNNPDWISWMNAAKKNSMNFIHDVEILHKTINIEMDSEEILVKENPDLNKNYFDIFNKITKKYQKLYNCIYKGVILVSSKYIVNSFTNDEFLEKNLYLNVLRKFQEDKLFIPIIYFSNNSDYKEYEQSISRHFFSKFESIIAPYEELTSIALNVSCVVSDNETIIEAATLVSTPVVKISFSKYKEESIYTSGPIKNGDIIVFKGNPTLGFDKNELYEIFQDPNEVIYAVKKILLGYNGSNNYYGKYSCIYQAKRNSEYLIYENIGYKKFSSDLMHLMRRIFFQKKIDDNNLQFFISYLCSNFGKSDVYSFIDDERRKVTSVAKQMIELKSIVKNLQDKKGKYLEFVYIIEKIIIEAKKNSLISTTLLVFVEELEDLILLKETNSGSKVEPLINKIMVDMKILTTILTELSINDFSNKYIENEYKNIF